MKPTLNELSNATNIELLAFLTACFYVFFTLLPDSHSLMVAWHWVFVWQIGLLCPIFWLLSLLFQKKLTYLNNHLDWIVFAIIIGLIISGLFAQFTNQARWYSLPTLSFISTLYALNHTFSNSQKRERLLIKQGYLNLAFIVISLFLWTTQTFIPELIRLEKLKQLGINLNYDFSVLELRNWAPIGHQNYVAGYLILCLPLLVGLSIIHKGRQRWLWISGVGLGLIDLYTTSSKAGWLSLIVICVLGMAIALFDGSISRRWVLAGGMGISFTIAIVFLTNNRLLNFIQASFQFNGGGELAYRIINANIGWQMGMSKPFTGIGLGGVPLLYQKYRPVWAGGESELIYQLHSTPAQLWAELGIWGIVPATCAIAILIYLLYNWFGNQEKTDKSDRVFVWVIYASFCGYGIVSLTDYQLDNIGISATLIIYLACLAKIFSVGTRIPTYGKSLHEWVHSAEETSQRKITPERVKSQQQVFGFVGVGIVLAVIIWLIPIHRAWQLSYNGFVALANKDINTFVKNLSEAQKLTPWEPYYPDRLGWNLGEIALQTKQPQQQADLLQMAIVQLQASIKIAPDREFSHSNLGWLLLNRDPKAASQAFANSVRLTPAKRGVFFGLGLSLLEAGKVDLATEAMALEALRHPLFITSPIWRSPGLKDIYPQVWQIMTRRYGELLAKDPSNQYWHQCRGSLYWWDGNFQAASADWHEYGNATAKLVLAIAEGKNSESNLASVSPATAAIVKAWLNPSVRSQSIEQAWIATAQTPIPIQTQEKISAQMSASPTFDRWLKDNTLIQQYRFKREGFGVVSRHIDGVQPSDFYLVVDNLPVKSWFAELFPEVKYQPEIDLALQPLREQLLSRLK
jgi:uncharacterized protein involved in response to NO